MVFIGGAGIAEQGDGGGPGGAAGGPCGTGSRVFMAGEVRVTHRPGSLRKLPGLSVMKEERVSRGTPVGACRRFPNRSGGKRSRTDITKEEEGQYTAWNSLNILVWVLRSKFF